MPTVTRRVHWDWPSPRFSDFQPIASSSHHSLPSPLPPPYIPLVYYGLWDPSLRHRHSFQVPFSGAWECGIQRRKGQRCPCLRDIAQGRGAFSFETDNKQNLLTSVCAHPPPQYPDPGQTTLPPFPHSRPAKPCQAFLWALVPSHLSSFMDRHSARVGTSKARALGGPGNPGSSWGMEKISLPFSSAERRLEFSEMNFTRK